MDKLVQEILIEKGYIRETLDVLQEALHRSEKNVVEWSAIGVFTSLLYWNRKHFKTNIKVSTNPSP